MSRRALFVSVTQSDIDFEGDGPNLCPISLSIANALNVGCNCVSVYEDEIILYLGRIPIHMKPPPDVVRFIKDWDDGKAVKPFGFCLYFEVAHLRLIG